MKKLIDHQIVIITENGATRGALNAAMNRDELDRSALDWVVNSLDVAELMQLVIEHYGREVVLAALEAQEPLPDPRDVPPIFGQRQEPWANMRYTEESYHTFHDYGCFIVALTSLVSWLGYNVDPLNVARALDEHDAFDGAQLMRPQVLSEVYAALGDYERLDWSGPADLAWLQAKLKRGPVVVQLDFQASWALDPHFVLAYAYQPDPDGGRHDRLMVMDPWDADRIDAAADVETNDAGKRAGGGYFWPVWFTGADMRNTTKTRVERLLWGARYFELEV